MKKFSNFGILALALVFCLVFVACKNDSPDDGIIPTKFEGEWYKTTSNNPLEKNTFKFTGDNFEHRHYDSNGVESYRVEGTFTSNDTSIVFSYGGQNLPRQYTLDADLKDLAIQTGDTYIVGGTYVGRRAASSLDDFAGTWKCLYAETDGANYTDFSYVFTGGNNFYFTTTHPNGGDLNLNWPGTFTYTNTGITFTPQPVGPWVGYTAKYHFEGSKILWIDALPAQHGEMLFVKQ